MAALPPATTFPGSATGVVVGNLTPALFQPYRRSIGGIVAQVTIDEQASDDIQITEHPVEQGAPIADHAFKRPAVVTIRAGWSRQYAWDLSAESGIYGLLLGWQAALLPFDVITGKRTYHNMLIERLQVTTDNHNEYTLLATITCRQVFIVSTSTTTVAGASPNNANQANPPSTGNSSDGGTKPSTPVGSTPAAPATPTTPPTPAGGPGEVLEAGEVMNTPAATNVNNQMNANGAEPPNSPSVPDVLAA